MARPRLLLIDDEPALAGFVADAAKICGFQPIETGRDEDFRNEFDADRPGMVALDLGMPGMDGVELLRFLADRQFGGPVLIISGFDRRILESAFRPGKELGTTMVGPPEKTARLDDLEAILRQHIPSPAP